VIPFTVIGTGEAYASLWNLSAMLVLDVEGESRAAGVDIATAADGLRLLISAFPLPSSLVCTPFLLLLGAVLYDIPLIL
jgi:hypothetical protein